ncbi:MAG TPA: hypothetical protein VH538_08745 [Gaiellaceae bacterium]|jgi:hypothetical protein
MDEGAYDHDIVVALAATQVLLARLERGDASKALAGDGLIDELRRFRVRLEASLAERTLD